MAYQTRATDQTGLAHGPARDPGSTVGQSRSIPPQPVPGCRHSTTSIAGSLLRQVCTTSAMTTRKQSPSAPSVTGRQRSRIFASPASTPRRLDAVDRAGVQREPRVSAQIRALARVQCGSETPARRLRTPPLRGDPSAATWRSSCAGQRRTALGPAARTPVRRVRHPATPSPAMITSIRQHGPGIGCPPSVQRTRTTRRNRCHRESVSGAGCRLSTSRTTVS
jgi:hypothetical protein